MLNLYWCYFIELLAYGMFYACNYRIMKTSATGSNIMA